MLKNFLLILLALFIIIPSLWSIYAYLYLRISEPEARNIALRIIAREYSTRCGGNFEKHLTVKIDGYNAKYEYYSNNGICNIFLNIDEYGDYNIGIWDNDNYVSSGSVAPMK